MLCFIALVFFLRSFKQEKDTSRTSDKYYQRYIVEFYTNYLLPFRSGKFVKLFAKNCMNVVLEIFGIKLGIFSHFSPGRNYLYSVVNYNFRQVKTLSN